MTSFVDANNVVRLLAPDHDRMHEQCRDLFERAERGEVNLVPSEAIIAEVVYILASPALYRIPRTELATALTTVLSNPGLQLDHTGAILRALDRYAQMNLDFADSLCIEHTIRLRLDGTYSYGRDFDGVSEIS